VCCVFYLQFFNYVLWCMCCVRLSYWIKITYLQSQLCQEAVCSGVMSDVSKYSKRHAAENLHDELIRTARDWQLVDTTTNNTADIRLLCCFVRPDSGCVKHNIYFHSSHKACLWQGDSIVIAEWQSISNFSEAASLLSYNDVINAHSKVSSGTKSCYQGCS